LTETEAINRELFVSRILKLVIVVVCFSLCGAGTFMVSMAREESKPQQEMNATPVKNHEIAPRVFTWA
jgi:hypothetical protein